METPELCKSCPAQFIATRCNPDHPLCKDFHKFMQDRFELLVKSKRRSKMYYLAIKYEEEGWSLVAFNDLDVLKEAVLSGQTHGHRFKVLREIEIVLDGDKQ